MFSVAVIISAVVVSAAKPQYVETFNVAPDDVEIHDQSVRTSFSPYHETWRQYKIDYGKSYKNHASEERHKAIFIQNVKWFEQHNTKFVNGETSYSVGLSRFTDMTKRELQTYHGYRSIRKLHDTRHNCYRYEAVSGLELPTHVDWRTRGYVTSVKDQEYCLSGYAFSAAGSLEGQLFKKTGKLASLSAQQLVDCSKLYSNHGCYDGGLPARAFAYIQARGIELDERYPYTAGNGSCKYKKSEIVANITGCKYIEHYSESDLQQAVATIGPIAATLCVTERFSHYKHGVFEDSCGPDITDHAQLVVGYGTLNETDYWIVKSSFSTHFGIKGYIYIARNKGNQLGLATDACYPLV